MYDRDHSNDAYWKVVGEYSALRRKHCDVFYKFPFTATSDILVAEIAQTILEIGATVEDFLGAQFQGATAVDFPELSGLCCFQRESIAKWKLYVFNRNVKQHIRTQKIYLENATMNWGISAAGAVLLVSIPFAAWFRMMYIEVPSDEWIGEAMDEISNPVLYQAVKDAGYDINKITHWR